MLPQEVKANEAAIQGMCKDGEDGELCFVKMAGFVWKVLGEEMQVAFLYSFSPNSVVNTWGSYGK